MNIHATDWTMISDITPESAYRVAERGERVWRLSWLPDRLLTREQALAGMELDEILSDPSAVHDPAAHEQVATRAARLGIIWQQAVILLSKRIAARLRLPGEPHDHGTPTVAHPPAGRSFRSHQISLPDRGLPRVYG